MQNLNWLGEYKALTQHAGLVDLGHRTQIQLTGADRATFLHNLCTNEIRKLMPGAGCEAFLTSVQGKTLAHAFIFATDDSLLLDTVPGEVEKILKHLDHYLVCEQVALTDRSGEWSELLVAGAESERLLSELTGERLPEVRLAHAVVPVAGKSVWLRRVDLTGPIGFAISTFSDSVAMVRDAILQAGVVACGPAAFEAARIEARTPLFGLDITEKNLPQELARDALAISFVKGCYLGQETVARIDALGHVNKTLVGLRFTAHAIPKRGQELSAAGEVVGHVASATYSPRLDAPLALAYIRTGHNAPQTRLASTAGEAEVVALPLS